MSDPAAPKKPWEIKVEKVKVCLRFAGGKDLNMSEEEKVEFGKRLLREIDEITPYAGKTIKEINVMLREEAAKHEQSSCFLLPERPGESRGEQGIPDADVLPYLRDVLRMGLADAIFEPEQVPEDADNEERWRAFCQKYPEQVAGAVYQNPQGPDGGNIPHPPTVEATVNEQAAPSAELGADSQTQPLTPTAKPPRIPQHYSITSGTPSSGSPESGAVTPRTRKKHSDESEDNGGDLTDQSSMTGSYHMVTEGGLEQSSGKKKQKTDRSSSPANKRSPSR